MKEIVKSNLCSGCHACFNCCPKKAIIMNEDKKGFLYPTIDQSKCINCGLCKRICPVLNKSKEIKKDVIAYASYNKNFNERINSSSGGIFVLLAKEIINRNGVVFGAAFDKQFEVVHSFIDKADKIDSFMGSKYTQSTIGDTYKKAKEFLDNDRYVLFSGTPCQIEGLFSYLRKDYDKLYTQDIICHGVASPKAWRKYLLFQKNRNGSKILNIQFRNKDKGWSLFGMKIFFSDKVYSKSLNKDMYLQTFLKNICLRDSCYNCSFKNKYRKSDITLADYWGVKRIHPNMDDDRGTSLVLLNTSKGVELFDSIESKTISCKTNLEDALKFNPALKISAKHCINEELYCENIDKMTFDELYKEFVPKENFIECCFSNFKRIIKRIIKKY